MGSENIMILVALFFVICVSQIQADECHLTPVIHKLQYPGCQEKRIPSYACVGRCTSYVNFLALKSGKRKDHACVVRRVEKELLWCLWIVLMPQRANLNRERWLLEPLLIACVDPAQL